MEISSISPASSTPAATQTPETALTPYKNKPQPTRESHQVGQEQQGSSTITEGLEIQLTSTSDKESLRLAMVNEGARNYVGDKFAVSDVTFTIIKDPYSGEYITRFRSLRDGTVTYIPEQEVMTYSQIRRQLGNLEETYA